jgi:hypothetical protein
MTLIISVGIAIGNYLSGSTYAFLELKVRTESSFKRLVIRFEQESLKVSRGIRIA